MPPAREAALGSAEGGASVAIVLQCELGGLIHACASIHDLLGESTEPRILLLSEEIFRMVRDRVASPTP